MPSGLSEIAIYNMALDFLDEEVAASPDDDSAVVRWLKRNFASTRDAALVRHPWNFALARGLLPARTTGPAFGWRYAYDEPSDCLRVLPLTADGTLNGAPVPFESEGGLILTDAAAPLKVRYIRRVDNPGLFDPVFGEFLAARLAWKMAQWVTGKSSYADRMKEAQGELLREARLADALTGTPPLPVDDDWINVR